MGKSEKPSSPKTKTSSSSSKVEESKEDQKDVEETPKLLPATPKRFLGLIAINSWIIFFILLVPTVYFIYKQVIIAYKIRLYAIRDFGEVIHEFDPWFNFRATQYLSKHGWHKFFHWFDYMSWYPLGRPVGTTIYPGLQITAVVIHRTLRYLGKPYAMTLNAVCCYTPAWGGSFATVFLSLLAYECSGSLAAAAISAAVFAIQPAHIMRSVGGGFDNECIAMSAMVMTFYFWVRSLRTHNSWPIGVLTGLSYGYMVAAWGGFIFVLNMIVAHAVVVALMDLVRNRYSNRLFYAYSLFYVIGTAIATRVPPVGMMPFKSLEQLSATAVFIGFVALHLSETERVKKGAQVLSVQAVNIRLRYLGIAAGITSVPVLILGAMGYFGPLTSRVRALFVQHTKTGNPLVDSVAEHRPADANAYWTYLHYSFYVWSFGMLFVWLLHKKRLRAAAFLFCYGVAAYYFSLRMARLILLSAPVASAMCGVFLGGLLDWAASSLLFPPNADEVPGEPEHGLELIEQSIEAALDKTSRRSTGMSGAQVVATIKRVIAVILIAVAYQVTPGLWKSYTEHAESMANAFSNPRVMIRQWHQGRPYIIDDYRQAYWWLRDKTPADARVLSWWDYGYQITGIGNRTTLADGNTWNHEHIATLGVMLSSPVKKAHSLIRHVADYVLVWAGQGNDDLGKSPHMARIGNSVYRGHCPHDPLCSQFTFQAQNYEKPTKMMRESLLYHAYSHNVKPGVRMPSKYFQEAYSSKHGLVRIFKVMNVSQESKEFLADPANRKCDAPGSWYCEGQYPPVKVWQDLIASRRNFGQLENFNVKRQSDDDAYYDQYMKRIRGQNN